MDRQPVDLDLEGPTNGVSDGRIDLASDLGDRDAMGDGQIELDRQGRAADGGRQGHRALSRFEIGGVTSVAVAGSMGGVDAKRHSNPWLGQPDTLEEPADNPATREPADSV